MLMGVLFPIQTICLLLKGLEFPYFYFLWWPLKFDIVYLSLKSLKLNKILISLLKCSITIEKFNSHHLWAIIIVV